MSGEQQRHPVEFDTIEGSDIEHWQTTLPEPTVNEAIAAMSWYVHAQ